MIKACDYIKTAFSSNDAECLGKQISELLKNDNKIVVDFKGITIFTTLFFNNAFAKYVIEIGPKKYDEKFELINLSELGHTTYMHSYNNAINYYNLSEKQKKIQNKEVSHSDIKEDN